MPEQFAIVLGSGCADFVSGAQAQSIDTDYGAPSAPVYRRSIAGHDVLALMRHGDQHSIAPHAINYRANVAALKACGSTAIIALNTVGAVSEIRDGGQIGIPDQLIDYTWGREHTFNSTDSSGIKHIDFTEPFSASLRQRLLAAAAAAGINCHDGGIYAATQGPRLETAAEVDRLERDGVDYVGMTAMPEAALAAELDIDYACIALVVNKAAGRGDVPIHEDVIANSASARADALRLIEQLLVNEPES